MAAKLEERSAALLRAKNFATVSTLREDGSVLAVVVWVDLDEAGEQIILNSAEGRAWPANVARDPRVTITVADAANPYDYLSINGRVVARDTENGDADIDALAKKYLDADSYPFRKEGEVRVTLKVEPEHVTHPQQG